MGHSRYPSNRGIRRTIPVPASIANFQPRLPYFSINSKKHRPPSKIRWLAGSLFVGNCPLFTQPGFLRSFRTSFFLANLRRVGDRQDEGAHLLERVLNIAAPLPIPLAGEHQFPALGHSAPITGQKTVAHRLGKTLRLGHIPPQNHLGACFVHVLPTRPGTANKRQAEFRTGNGNLVGDDKRGQYSHGSVARGEMGARSGAALAQWWTRLTGGQG